MTTGQTEPAADMTLTVVLEAAKHADLSLLAEADGRSVEEYARCALEQHLYGRSRILRTFREILTGDGRPPKDMEGQDAAA